jgi:DNA invertase Pin-like site-specific DNA recombinase
VRILGYVRVSTAEQASSGLGLDAQESLICSECERRGWKLTELVRDEGHSGKSLERPGLQQALTLLAQQRADGLVVAKLDRLTRSVLGFSLLLEWFVDVDATLVALDLAIDTSTPAGRLMANVLASFAEWERDMIAARTRAGLAALRARGKPTGRPSVADRPELAAWIRHMRDEEHMTLQQIADKLNADEVPTIRGGQKWRPSSVQRAAGYERRQPRRRSTALPATGRRGSTSR